MQTKVIFNTDKRLKKAVMEKARKQGMTMSGVLNLAMNAYESGRIQITALERDIARAREDISAGRTISHADLMKKYGL